MNKGIRIQQKIQLNEENVTTRMTSPPLFFIFPIFSLNLLVQIYC